MILNALEGKPLPDLRRRRQRPRLALRRGPLRGASCSCSSAARPGEKYNIGGRQRAHEPRRSSTRSARSSRSVRPAATNPALRGARRRRVRGAQDLRDRPARPRPPLRDRRREDPRRARLAAAARLRGRARARRCAGTSSNPTGARRSSRAATGRERARASASASPTRSEGDHPRRRLRHAAVPADARRQQAAPAHLRQADDLLPAQHADAGGHPRHPRHHDARTTSRPSSACSATAARSACASPTRRSRGPRAWPRRSSSAASFVGQDAVALALGDNIFYGARPRRVAAAGGGHRRRGATVFAYRVRDPRALRRRRVRRDRPRHRASRRSRRSPRSPYAVTGLYFYDNQVLDIAAALQALAARRARDHRRQPRLPRQGRPARRDARPRHGLARHRHARGAAAGLELHPGHRAAAGPEGRLPRGGRLQDGLHRPRRTCSRLARTMKKNEYGAVPRAHDRGRGPVGMKLHRPRPSRT